MELGSSAISGKEIGVSFLYGARVHNLYIVKEKFCLENAESAPPWKPLELGSGKKYFFPFRFKLELLREFDESLTRAEFAYVAENLLLRGGYRKTHFQADRTDLGHASRLGIATNTNIPPLINNNPRFELKFTLDRSEVNEPKVFFLKEQILQAVVRHYLSDEKKLEQFLEELSIDSLSTTQLEVLGEKALPHGYIDILIKEATPTGLVRKMIVEVKKSKASSQDFQQLIAYREEFGKECIGAVLIAKEINEKLRKRFSDIKTVTYSIEGHADTYTFQELVKSYHVTMDV